MSEFKNHCGYIELQNAKWFEGPAVYGNPKIATVDESRKSDVDYLNISIQAKQHFSRNMKEWPVCNYGGRIEVSARSHSLAFKHGETTKVEYGLLCRACRTRILGNI